MNDVAASVRALSRGPKHHFFGYYGMPAWDRSQRYHLSLETIFHDRAPEKNDEVAVGLVDVKTGEFEPCCETSAFNLQQGSMMHWIDVGFGEEFTYNDWEDGNLVSRAVSPETGRKRTIRGAIAAVSPTAPVAVGLNFGRMSYCRKVVGYANDIHTKDNVVAVPRDDGLFSLDLRTGESRLLVSIAEVVRALPVEEAGTGPAWFNHVVFNTDGTRLLFFCRIRREGGRYLTSVWSVNLDGSELDCQIGYGHVASHFAWSGPREVVISTNVLGGMRFIRFTDRERDFEPFGEGLFPRDGHNAFSPDFRWVACDAYPRHPKRECELMLYDVEKKAKLALGVFHHPEQFAGDCRCDLHPRWSPDGRTISFDSVHEGSRQIYVADVRDIVR